MVNAHNIVPAKLENSAYRVANNSGAEVSHVHLLRYVRGGEVDENFARRGRGRHGSRALCENAVDEAQHCRSRCNYVNKSIRLRKKADI